MLKKMRQRKKKYAISNIKVKSQSYNKNVNNPIWGLKGIFDLENTALSQECLMMFVKVNFSSLIINQS